MSMTSSYERPKAATMQDLNSSEELKRKVRHDARDVTLLSIISPVCPLCRHGFAVIQTVLKNIPDDRLRVHIAFLPMYAGDSKSRAQTRKQEFNDKRVTYYWDGNKLAGSEWQKVLG